MAEVVEFYRKELARSDSPASRTHESSLMNRIQALQRIRWVASEVGSGRLRKDILPMLVDVVKTHRDQEDVMFEAANALRAMADLMGDPAHVHLLYDPLFKVAQSEDINVRQRALEVVVEVIKIGEQPVAHMKEHVLPRILSLAKSEWFTQTTSAAYLIANLIQYVDASRAEELLTVRFCFSKHRSS